MAGASLYEPAVAGTYPPLVLIPGVNGSRELFSTLAPRLALRRQVIAVDLGEKIAAASTVIDSAVDDVAEILAGIAPGPIDVLGQSFGSIVAVRLWRQGGVRRLLLAPPAVHPRRGPLVILEWFAKAGVIRLWPASQEEHLQRLIVRSGGYTPEPEIRGEELGNLIRRVRSVRVWPLLRRMNSLRNHSWEWEMAGMSAPVLVIEGEKEMATLPPALLEFFRQRPDTEVAIVPGGHMPFLAHPEEFQKTVVDFLDRG
jgi:pimeloyl-ACP methyl ester carboxylesterase